MTSARVADVAIDPRTGGSEAVFSYLAGDSIRLGDAVFVPLGTRMVMGFVTDVRMATSEDIGFPIEQLKPIETRVEGLTIPEAVLDLCRFVAEEYLCPLPSAMGPASPPGVRERLATAWNLVESEREFRLDGETGHPLSPLQREVLAVLRDKGGTLIDGHGKRIAANTLRTLRALQARGLVEPVQRLVPFAERRKTVSMLRLTADEAKVEDFLKREGRRKPAQALTVITLQGSEQGRFTLAEIKALAGVTEVTIKALVDSGILERTADEERPTGTPHSPNSAQQIAIDAVSEAVARHEPRGFLLYGVTGSGKTEVYLRAAAEALRRGRQVLYLVPEIALAAQAIWQLRERFGRTVTVMHSDLAAGERLQNWTRIRDGDACVVLGARSALFAPLTDIGLIVVDEEHEASYKQESSPRYHTKALAQFLSRRHGCPVVLGSATPSLESFQQAEAGEASKQGLTLLSLPARAASAQLPTVVIDDLTLGYRRGTPAIIAPELKGRLEQTLARGQQAILFLNRRAYAPFVICRDCGHQMACPHCAVSLSFHRRDGKLRCHHCGFHRSPPEDCPGCGGSRLNPFGVGTEKVEEAVSALFPDAVVARLDRDIARRKGALEETLARFRSGEVQVLVGTQMVAKGLDFPNVTLVGVIAADVSLNLPDFRSSERTFQLLSQVAGRSGRGLAAGSVVVQTFNPGHVAVTCAAAHDFLGAYEAIRAEREEAGYPPFRRLVNVVLSGEGMGAVVQAGLDAAKLLHSGPWEMLGPTDCPVERLQNKWRRHLLLKLPPGASAAPVAEALLGFDPKGVQIVVDVDPYSLM